MMVGKRPDLRCLGVVIVSCARRHCRDNRRVVAPQMPGMDKGRARL